MLQKSPDFSISIEMLYKIVKKGEFLSRLIGIVCWSTVALGVEVHIYRKQKLTNLHHVITFQMKFAFID